MNFDNFYERPEFASYRKHFREAIQRRSDTARHGDLDNWLNILSQLPDVAAKTIDLARDTVFFGDIDEISPAQAQAIHAGLFALSPWRKGPYSVFGSRIDTEWRSDWKWQRLIPHLSSLQGKTVLDVGCGSGYHCWRMLGNGADYVLGIDPSMRFQIQHRALQRFARNTQFDMLPIGIEDMPQNMQSFDTVFSMGVLYHRKDPEQHVKELFDLLKPGGQLILETLIVDERSEPTGIFTPADRYAQMRNVWSITTVAKTLELVDQAGFTDSNCANVNVTSLSEQRQTDWMTFHSLEQFLDPHDLRLTIEGHPAPVRGLFTAYKPE